MQLGLLSVLSAAAVLLSPLPPALLDFTRNFRLNEVMAGACRDGSVLAAGPLLLLLAAAVGGLGLLPLLLPLLPSGAGVGQLLAGADVSSGRWQAAYHPESVFHSHCLSLLLPLLSLSAGVFRAV
jgi:hypothetical protein